MSNPMTPVPDEQARAVQLALCERLGLDPAEVSHIGWEAVAGETHAKLTVTAYLPENEVREMFNAAGRPA